MVVITWQGQELLDRCLCALAGQDRPHKTLVVDNAADRGTRAVLARHSVEILRLPRNLGYAGGLAAALPTVDTPYLAWLNDDAAPEPGWLAALEEVLDANPDTAAVSARLESPDGRVQSIGVSLTADGHGVDDPDGGLRSVFCDEGHHQGDFCAEGHHQGQRQGRETFGFCGGAALLRTGALREIGGVPAEFFCYYEDTDTSWRLRLAGHRIRSVPAARVRHLHGASTRPGSPAFHRWNERNRLLMLIRCAPAAVAARETARFAVITSLLPIRRLRGTAPHEANFAVGLRLRVLTDLLVGLPRALLARRNVRTAVSRREVWHTWAGCARPGQSR